MNFVKVAVLPSVLVLGFANVAAAEDAATTTTPMTVSTPSAPASLSTTAPAQNDPNELICRKGEPPIGSRIPGPSVCHTRAEWDAMRQQSREDTMKLQTTSGAGKPSGM